MKLMKRLTALVLSAAMVLSMSVTALATGGDNTGETTSNEYSWRLDDSKRTEVSEITVVKHLSAPVRLFKGDTDISKSDIVADTMNQFEIKPPKNDDAPIQISVAEDTEAGTYKNVVFTLNEEQLPPLTINVIEAKNFTLYNGSDKLANENGTFKMVIGQEYNDLKVKVDGSSQNMRGFSIAEGVSAVTLKSNKSILPGYCSIPPTGRTLSSLEVMQTGRRLSSD